MQKGVKFRAYPNKEQQNLINQTFGCCRLICNKGLTMRNDAYENGQKTGCNQTSAMLTERKKSDDFAFLKKEFYCDSNGNAVNNPKYLEKSMRKRIREQRRLSYKHKGSNNRNQQRIKVVKVHEKITNQRNDFLQKQSTMLLRENQTICIEDLNVKGMLRNHKLSKSIASVSWSKFFTMLAYKTTWYGNDIIKVPTMYPSSQICCCGYKNPLIKNLSVRSWECPNCHTMHDRDMNAS